MNRVSTSTISLPERSAQSASQQRIVEALAEYHEAVDAGRRPDREEFLEKYADIREELTGYLESFDLIRAVAPQLTAGTSPPLHGEGLGEGSRTLGDFRILRELGRGGMGVVYEAEQISLGRRVALKVLPFAAMLDRQQLARFKNEARAAATLDHPNIVAIYSVGCERGVHYYAMQLVTGQSLAEVIAELKSGPCPSDAPPAPPAEGIHKPADQDTVGAALSTLRSGSGAAFFQTVARLGIQAAEALDHAHQHGILHRDIKPANLLVDDTGKLWITDFGLARMEQDAGMTMTGDLLGTLRYMSPEQALAKRAVVDHRSDIYSLAVTLYELLTLQPAFSGDDRNELLRQIASDEPRKPRQINARIPHDLETIILKAIEKNPADRYATAQDFADDLRRFADDRSIRARRPTLLQRARRIIGRHRIAATIIAGAAFLFVVVATAYLADRRRQAKENNRFVENSLQAARSALESNKVDEAVQRMAEAQARIDAEQLVDSNLAKDTVALKSESDRYAKFAQLYKAARNDRSDQGVIVAAARDALALYQVMEDPRWFQVLQQGGFPKAHVDRVSDALYELLLLNTDQLVRWPDHWPKATRQARLEAQCLDAIEHLEKAIAFHPPSRGYYWLMANCALIMGDREKEKRLRTTALETPPHDAAELFYVNRDRWWGTMSKYHGYPEYTFDETYKDHREMLRLDPTYYNAMFFMTYRLAQEDRYAEALVGWYACLAIKPGDAAALGNRGRAHSRLGFYDEAKADYEAELTAAPNNPRALGHVAMNLASDPSEVMRDGKRAVELAQKACQLTKYQDANLVDTLACAYAETGDFDSAVKWSTMAVELCDNYKREEYAKHLKSFRQGNPWRDE